MTGLPVSLLSAATTITGAELIPIVQGGETVQSTTEQIKTYIGLPVGGMMPYAGSSAPTGWLLCDGTAVSRSTYSDLFTAISTTWGVGDGSTTFNLPDLREAAPVGVGTSASSITSHDTYTLGQFKDDQMQGHWHNVVESDATSTLIPSSSSAGTFNPSLDINNGSDAAVHIIAAEQITDGTNGTPRTGTTTRGKRIGVNYIIKY